MLPFEQICQSMTNDIKQNLKTCEACQSFPIASDGKIHEVRYNSDDTIEYLSGYRNPVIVPDLDTFDREVDIPVGPISTLVPQQYHAHIPRGILKSLVCETEESASKMRRKIGVADIPVITKKYSETVYDHILKNLTAIGKDVKEEVHPWIVNVLVDWANLNKLICSCPIEPSELDKHDRVEVAGSSKVPISKSAMDKTNSYSSIKTWKPQEEMKLIDIKVKNDFRFNKPGTKKKIIWQDIAEEFNKDGSTFTFQQCEQKWKNFTKTFRDTVDHNSKSGNDKGDDDRRQIPVVEWDEKTETRKKYVRPDAAKIKEESLNDKALTILKENVAKVDNSKVISVLKPQPGEPSVFERYRQLNQRRQEHI
ncbi:unnamed protein product [Mytilus coruscus]|uniref:Myb-like domain-containing protein n=1 Tax=Mytilus coruscus TaxID=42192 RepID=A0A6J8DI83_MYTCO|nr:unnamed protein product [Mytilus coruscus]